MARRRDLTRAHRAFRNLLIKKQHLTSSAPILQVVFDTPMRQSFDYLPAAGAPPPGPGQRVRVPFGRQRAIGIVAAHAESSALPRARLKQVTQAIDTAPLWDEATFGVLRWAADYYHHPLGDVLFGALPKKLREGAAASREEIVWRLSAAGRAGIAAGARLGSRQRALVALVGEDGAVLPAITAAGHAAALRALAARGWLESFARSAPPPPAGAGRPGPVLTADQGAAVAAVGASLGRFGALLLHGVTGSGKTEVYLRLVERGAGAGRGALVLVPEIALTPQLSRVSRTLRRAARGAAFRAGRGRAARGLARARRGERAIVIGTRSAVFAPLPALGVVIVDEEHDASYKQQEGFRYSARDLAVMRARRPACRWFWALPRHRSSPRRMRASGAIRAMSLPERAGRGGQPRMRLIDLRAARSATGSRRPRLASHEATPRDRRPGAHLSQPARLRADAVLPGLRLDRAVPHCDARLTVHLRSQRLRCHHCGAEQPMPLACPRCGHEIKPVGQGTERIEDR